MAESKKKADNTGEGEHPPPPESGMKTHFGLLTTGALFSLMAVRVLVATDGEVNYALAVLNSSGLVAVTLGVALAALPYLAIGAAVLLGLSGREERKRRGSSRWGSEIEPWVGGFIVFIAVAFSPVFPTLISLAAKALFLLSVVGIRKRTSGSLTFGPQTLLEGTVVFVIAGLVVTSGQMWLPAERIQFDDHADVVVAYVVDDSDGWLTYLHDRDRTVHRVKSATAVSRTVCGLDFGIPTASMYSLLAGGAAPPCYGDDGS